MVNSADSPRPEDAQSGPSEGGLPRPNIVIILADDLGFSDIGCYGSEISTPAIDSLAQDGLRFSQMYNSGRCCPSRASLLTGLNPHQAGIGHMTYTPSATNPAYQGYLNDSCVTIAEPLQAAGYRTLMSGKWHVAQQRKISERASWPDDRPGYPLPTERGFDEFYGTIGGGGSYFKPTYLMQDETLIEQTDPSWFYTDALTDKAIDMVDRAVDDATPFFLYLAFTAPHWPLHASEEDIAKVGDRYRPGWDRMRTARHEELKASGILDPKWPISARDPAAWPWEEARYPEWEAHRMAVYAAQVNRMDQGIGRLVEALRQRGELDNTLIFFLSDNGGCAEFLAEDGGILDVEPGTFAHETPDGLPVHFGNSPTVLPGGPQTFQSYGNCWSNASNSPFRKFKRWVHEGGISTPLVVHWPNAIPGPGIVHAAVHIMDIMPTCLDVAGATYPREHNDRTIEPCEGESLRSVFDHPDWTRSQPIFFEHEGNRALRDGEWKLVSADEGTWELYNIEDDRPETNDLARKETRRVDRMQGEWHSWASRMGVNLNLRHELASLFAAENAYEEPELRRRS